ncbi:hypothetical protein CALCODRAFT_498717 [Calocera cornea HHB12733]|uniref:F-box domain-containing protein n=1 Tax=Calocera cornea HHB12733 TaxID=1353952 RepID=A0A165ER30_9BASI|nr:hypothetical protein CALCODRAFT_498717 [Calocera cornea HHB12733]
MTAYEIWSPAYRALRREATNDLTLRQLQNVSLQPSNLKVLHIHIWTTPMALAVMTLLSDAKLMEICGPCDSYPDGLDPLYSLTGDYWPGLKMLILDSFSWEDNPVGLLQTLSSSLEVLRCYRVPAIELAAAQLTLLPSLKILRVEWTSNGQDILAFRPAAPLCRISAYTETSSKEKLCPRHMETPLRRRCFLGCGF